MGKRVFSSEAEKNTYFSVLEAIFNAIHSYENKDESYYVTEDNYETTEEDILRDISAGRLLKEDGSEIKRGVDLFTLLMRGANGADLAEGKNSFLFSVYSSPEKDYHLVTVDKNGSQIDKENVYNEKVLDRIVSSENRKDREKFGKFADTLRNAAKSTSRDSGEYKKIIEMLEGFNEKGVNFSKAPHPGAEDWKKLDKEQRLALPLILLRDRINKYFDHKIKDGIKQNTFHKLAAIEELNQYIGERIEQINPRDFSFNNISYVCNTVKKDASEEFKSINRVRVQEEKEKLLFHGLVESNVKRAVEESILSIKTKDIDVNLYDKEEMKNVSNCMDRMILRAQTKYEGKKQETVVSNLEKVRKALTDNPLERMDKTAKVEMGGGRNSLNR